MLGSFDRRINNIVTWVLSRRQSDLIIWRKDMSRCPWGIVILIMGIPMFKLSLKYITSGSPWSHGNIRHVTGQDRPSVIGATHLCSLNHTFYNAGLESVMTFVTIWPGFTARHIYLSKACYRLYYKNYRWIDIFWVNCIDDYYSPRILFEEDISDYRLLLLVRYQKVFDKPFCTQCAHYANGLTSWK